MNYCIASTGDGHEGTVLFGDVWMCQAHANRRRALESPPKNLARTMRKLKRLPQSRRAKYLRSLSERDRVWVSKTLAGG